METLKQQVQALDPADWRAFLAWVVTDERQRRDNQLAVEQAQADLVTDLQDAGKLDKPEATDRDKALANPVTVAPWVDPGTDHSKMYHYGDVVQHKGNIVESTHRGLNHWEPGTLAFDGRIWRIIGTVAELQAATERPATEPSAPEFKQPTGGHDAYKKGDRVTYNGQVYESTMNGNAYSPHAYPAGWKKI